MRGPVSDSCADKTVFRDVVIAHAVEIDACTQGSEDAGVDNRELPRLPVVYLLTAYQECRSGRKGADLDLPLVFKAFEVLLEREKHVGRILRRRGIIGVLLLESV